MLSKDLMEILRCPQCRGVVEEVSVPEGLNCPRCHLLFGIVDGIPNMLIDEARPSSPPSS